VRFPAIVVLATLVAAPAAAQELSLDGWYSLPSQLELGWTNPFRPQGLGFDEDTGELLFVQQAYTFVQATDQRGS